MRSTFRTGKEVDFSNQIRGIIYTSRFFNLGLPREILEMVLEEPNPLETSPHRP